MEDFLKSSSFSVLLQFSQTGEDQIRFQVHLKLNTLQVIWAKNKLTVSSLLLHATEAVQVACVAGR